MDYEDLFSPVVQYASLRYLPFLVIQRKWQMVAPDIKTAFLNAHLDEELYMEQPEHFIIPGKERMVYRLLKAIYGLKQASKAWRKFIAKLLKQLKCDQSKSDPSIFILVKNGKVEALILTYVDDFIISGRNSEILMRIAQYIASKVEVRVETEVEEFLGMVVEHDDSKPYLNSLTLQ